MGRIAVFGACVALMSVACVQEGEIDTASDGVTSINGLTMNGLTMNGLTMNGLTMNGLTMNGLAAGEAGNIADFKNLSPELLAYFVKCARGEGQAPMIIDGTKYFGVLGFAPTWPDLPLTPLQKSGMSACLLSHVNAYGVHVPISVRSESIADATQDEMDTFGAHEGSFYGDLFGRKMTRNACAGNAVVYGAPDAKDYLEKRECAKGTSGSNNTCDFLFVGSCRDDAFIACEGIEGDKADSVCHDKVAHDPSSLPDIPGANATTFLLDESVTELPEPDCDTENGETAVAFGNSVDCLKCTEPRPGGEQSHYLWFEDAGVPACVEVELIHKYYGNIKGVDYSEWSGQ